MTPPRPLASVCANGHHKEPGKRCRRCLAANSAAYKLRQKGKGT